MLQSSIMTEHLYPDQSSVLDQQVAPADGEVETVACEWCGWSLCNRQLGKRALKMDAEEAPKVPKRRFETPEEMLRDFSQRNPERAAQIRNKFSPAWDLGERERIGDDWNLPTIDDRLWETYRKNRLNDHSS